MEENNKDNQSYKLPRWIIAVLLLSLLFNVVTYFRVANLKREIWNAQNNLASINGSISSTVASNMNMINELLKKEASLVSEFKFEFGKYKDKKTDILLKVKPKSYTEGDKLYFSYRSGSDKPVLVEAQTSDKINFEAAINVSIMYDIELDLVVENGTERKNEKLETIYRPADKLAAQLSAQPQGGTLTFNKDKSAIIISFGFSLVDISGGFGRYKLSDVNLVIEVNGNAISTQAMTYTNDGRYNIQLKSYKIPCKTGDTVDIYIKAKDDKGFNYSSLVEAWKIGEGDSIEPNEKMEQLGTIVIE